MSENGENKDYLEEQKAKLAAFLRKLNPEVKKVKVPPKNAMTGGSPFKRISMDEYSEPVVSPEMEAKIKELQAIIKQIEKRKVVADFPEELVTDEQYTVDYVNRLNREQLMAVVNINGPLLVIAGAGTGKTRVIVHRVSYLMENGVPPNKILLLTFTRKASREMLNRVQQLNEHFDASKVMGGTFHSFANHVLRKYAKMINLAPNFTIIDDADAQDIIDILRKELSYDKSKKAFPRKRRIKTIISYARNKNVSVKKIIEKYYPSIIEYIPDIELLFMGFTQYKKTTNLYDYDDLMELLRDGLRDHELFKKKVQKAYQYVMVDEYQDTNFIQKEILDYLAEGHQNIMVVGDDTQSIYAFRGANLENILRFPETYPKAKLIKLEKNYRSQQGILDYSNSIIDNFKLVYKKELSSDKPATFKPLVKKFYNAADEAEFIVDKILERREKDIPLSEMAVLYRSSYHANHIQTELLKRNLPYIVVGGLRFNERKHIKDMLAYLRILLNPFDTIAWHRVLRILPGIGQLTSGKIIEQLRLNNGLLHFDAFKKKKYYKGLDELKGVLLESGADHLSVGAKLDIIQKYYYPILKNSEKDHRTRNLDIKVLKELGGKYDKLEKFLSDLSLEPPSKSFQDQSVPLLDDSEESPLTLSTMHSAKGLEWNTVFVPHTLDGLFPSVRSLEQLEDIEEERRLFYVACTRAKEELYLTMPSTIFAQGEFFSYPSRFIVEVEEDLYDY